jgi:hydroxymethylpyrimidine/phosphomethylpyrimidine kinase
MTQPRILVVAGHDPSGGAGIDADRAALAGLALDAQFVVTAWTDQDDGALRALGARASGEWLAEARTVLAPRLSAIKFGLLPGADHVRAARELVRAARERACEAHTPATHERTPPTRERERQHERATPRASEARTTGANELALRPAALLPVIVDPVLGSSSGGRFLDADGIEALRSELCCAEIVLTPNLPEAAALACLPTRRIERSFAARVEAAQVLLGLGCSAVVLKGGHGSEDPVRDLVLVRDAEPVWLEHARVHGGKIRGSGCRFATRLAAGLALGRPLVDAAPEAGEWVPACIAEQAAGED